MITVAAGDAGEEDAPDGPVRPDMDKIFALISIWDHRCATPRACPSHRPGPHRGATTRFARRIGHRAQSFWNLRAPGKLIGPAFITQIADTLHVSWRDIALPGQAGTEAPQLPAEAEAQAA